MKTNEKLQLIIERCAHNNQSEFARRVGLAQSSIASWIKRGTGDLVKIAEAFPELSAEWLLRGEGDMFKSGHTQGNTQVNYGNNSVQAIGGSVSNCVSCPDDVNSPLYKSGPTSFDDEGNALVKQSNVLRVMRPEIPDQLSRQPDLNVYDYLVENKDNLNYEPFIPQLCEYTATKRVTTDAMAPEVRRGDKIAVKVMPTKNIIDGEMYLLDTTSRGLVLRVIHDEGDSFLCTSLNIDRYKDMSIKKEDVIRVWAVVGALKIYL